MKCVVFLLLHACLNLGNIKEGGFRPFNFENTILTYGLGVMAWTCTNNFRVVLGPCAQYCLSEASEQKMGRKQKTLKNEIDGLKKCKPKIQKLPGNF